MSTTIDSTAERSGHDHRRSCGSVMNRRGNWSGPNIVALVLGLALFWPFGLLVAFWIFRGRDVRELPSAVRRRWTRLRDGGGATVGARNGNRAFDAFQETQRERIRELREEIRERGHRFEAYREAARRRADEEEFERFMASAPGRSAD